MDAMLGILSHRSSLINVVILTLVLLGFASRSNAATHSSANFVVTASSDDVARRVANCAEYWRRELAIQWFDKPLPNWFRPCPITVSVGTMGASGQTTFTFENGEVHGWKMHVQGSMDRILDSVVPHEVNHTIFASHFRRPLPRWADEGAATLFEHESEQARQQELLSEVFSTTRRIPLKNLLTIREYPTDMRDVLTLYAEGYSLAGFLVGMKGEQGRKVYLNFLEDAHKNGWEKAIVKNYGFTGIDHLEQNWSNWILAGSPAFEPQGGTQLAANTTPAQEHSATQLPGSTEQTPELVVRSQSPQSDSAPSTSVRPAGAAQPVDATALESAPLFTASKTSDALQSIPRRLRLITESEGNAEQDETVSRLPRPAAHLSPTAEGIRTTANPENYSFPAARR